VFPPWQHGNHNDAINRGFEFTVPQVDDPADFHGDITDPKLVLYVGGNYFFDCPGCAWPDPKHTSSFEFCE
jgi:molybdate transport system substrate-binding protein